MAQANLYFLLLLSLLATTQAADQSAGHSRAFVEAECRATRYPNLCVNTLSNYVTSTTQSPQNLAHIALRVSLARAQHTRTFIIKVAKQLRHGKAKDYQAMRDCLDEINDDVDQLTRSVKELRGIKEEDERHFVWHQSNVETWMSTALTDALTCMDGFTGHGVGGKVRAILKAKVLNVAQLTSNALVLFNRYVTRHRASRATKP